MTEKSNLSNRAQSFRYAFQGLRTLVQQEANARIHLAATLIVITAAAILEIDSNGWRWLWVVIAAVWVTEALNTAIERIADAAVPKPHPLIREAKDVAAAAVLISAFAAVLIGLSVLGPALLRFLARI